MEFPVAILDQANAALANLEDAPLVASAVRNSLDYFAKMLPGKSVELRVPPYRVVQILGGTTHRRGTPPATVEMSPETWLNLVAGRLVWDAAITSAQIHASGTGSNLSQYLQINN